MTSMSLPFWTEVKNLRRSGISKPICSGGSVTRLLSMAMSKPSSGYTERDYFFFLSSVDDEDDEDDEDELLLLLLLLLEDADDDRFRFFSFFFFFCDCHSKVSKQSRANYLLFRLGKTPGGS